MYVASKLVQKWPKSDLASQIMDTLFSHEWYMQCFLIWNESISDSCFDSTVVHPGLHIGFSAPPFPDSSTKHPDFNYMCTLDISTFKTICIFLNYPLEKLVSIDIVIQIGQEGVLEDD